MISDGMILERKWFKNSSIQKEKVLKKSSESTYIDFDHIFWFTYTKVLVFFGALSVWCICGDYVCYMELVIPVMHKLCNCEVV